MTSPDPRRKQALSGLRGGRIEVRGDPRLGETLRHAMSVLGDAEPGDLTHGFHSYPARFHPLLVRRLLEAEPGARVLDPFVGSGTSLVEAALAGRAGFGVDVNPLAVELARLKAAPWPAAARAALATAAARIDQRVSAEVRAARRRSTPHAAPQKATRYDDPRWYAPHVFRELVALRQAIGEVADPALRGALFLVLSSIVVKVSRQRSDTDPSLTDRQVPRGAPTRHFARKAEELVQRMADFAARVPPGTPAPEVRLGDARTLAHLPDGTIDLVITSPPYLGTYDYAQHHARRFGWLGFDRRAMDHEIGARRSTRPDDPEVEREWAADLAACAAAIARVLRPGGRAFLLVGDSAIGARAIAGDLELRRAAGSARLDVMAVASQERPEVYAPARGKLPGGRREHLLALRKPA